MDDVTIAGYLVVNLILEKWYKQRATNWRQLSRERLMKGMDKNSKYFHTVASTKSRKKLLLEIKIRRRIFRNTRSIKKEIKKFYKQLYHRANVLIVDFQDGLVRRILVDNACMLEIFPMVEEILNVV